MITWESLCAYFSVDPGQCRHLVRCPCHEDSSASLSIRQTLGGKVLLHCFAGCDFGTLQQQIRGAGPRPPAPPPEQSSQQARPKDWPSLLLPLPPNDDSFARHLGRKIGTGTIAGYRRLYPKLRLIPCALGIPAIAVWDPMLGGQAFPLFADHFCSKTGKPYKKYTIPGTCCKVPLFFGSQKKGDRILICEGITDWLALAANNDDERSVYMPMLGAAQTLNEDTARILQTYETYCLFDSDKAGRDGARKLQLLTGCTILPPPDGCKDWREHTVLTLPFFEE